jgi:ATP adenylyltransferase
VILVDRIWSPWRMAYIEAPKDEGNGCIFCDLPAKGDDPAVHILARTELAFAILNSFPYNPGHLMVAPLRHTGELASLEQAERLEVDELLARSVEVLQRETSPEGFNLGMNLGHVAGAGIPDHLHWHVVPRWNGDTNFMPVVGQTRVLPELLQETYGRLAPGFARG